jgi:uncharacterized membrane protein
MESRAKFLGHAVHQMLIPFPLGLLPTAVVFDGLRFTLGDLVYAQVSYWLIAAGVVGGLVAAVFGLVDWLAIPRRTRAWRIGALHGAGNVVVLAAFAGSWLLRSGDGAQPSVLAATLAVFGLVLAGITGWLGGELVDRLAVGVDDDAHLNAESSLARRHRRAAVPATHATRS